MDLEGRTAVTVFCADPDPAAVAKRLATLGLAADVADDWSTVEVKGRHGGMTVTREMFAPDSPFSRAILVAHNAARLPKQQDAGAQARVLNLLESCDMLLQVAFAPALSASDERRAAVLALAGATGGLVFDGQTFIDGETGDAVLVARSLTGRA